MKYTMTGVPMETFIKRLFWLAWLASVTLGAGRLRARPNATEDEVWQNVCGQDDYVLNTNKPGKLDADYVFGRMMKLEVTFTATTFEITRGKSPRSEYQSWALVYPSVEQLIEATTNSFPGVAVVKEA